MMNMMKLSSRSRLLAAVLALAAAAPLRAAEPAAVPATATGANTATVAAAATKATTVTTAATANVANVANVATAAPASSAASSAATSPTGLDTRIQDLKGDVIRLNRDLLVLEEDLLFPASTQVALFVSMDVGRLFALDSVQVSLDDKVVANYLYTPLEVEALHRGGVQRLYLGNLRAGEHTLVAFFTGKGPHERDYKRGATLKIEKGSDPKYIELRIRDSTQKLQPEFDVKVWQ